MIIKQSALCFVLAGAMTTRWPRPFALADEHKYVRAAGGYAVVVDENGTGVSSAKAGTKMNHIGGGSVLGGTDGVTIIGETAVVGGVSDGDQILPSSGNKVNHADGSLKGATNGANIIDGNTIGGGYSAHKSNDEVDSLLPSSGTKMNHADGSVMGGTNDITIIGETVVVGAASDSDQILRFSGGMDDVTIVGESAADVKEHIGGVTSLGDNMVGGVSRGLATSNNSSMVSPTGMNPVSSKMFSLSNVVERSLAIPERKFASPHRRLSVEEADLDIQTEAFLQDFHYAQMMIHEANLATNDDNIPVSNVVEYVSVNKNHAKRKLAKKSSASNVPVLNPTRAPVLYPTRSPVNELAPFSVPDNEDGSLKECLVREEELKRRAQLPVYLYVQRSLDCTFKRKVSDEGIQYSVHLINTDDKTYAFSDRPYKLAYPMTTDTFADTFETRFADSPPNAAFTFTKISDSGNETQLRFAGPMISALVGKAEYYTETKTFVYNFDQGEQQEAILPLSALFEEDKNEASFELCSIFIDTEPEDHPKWSLEETKEYISMLKSQLEDHKAIVEGAIASFDGNRKLQLSEILDSDTDTYRATFSDIYDQQSKQIKDTFVVVKGIQEEMSAKKVAEGYVSKVNAASKILDGASVAAKEIKQMVDDGETTGPAIMNIMSGVTAALAGVLLATGVGAPVAAVVAAVGAIFSFIGQMWKAFSGTPFKSTPPPLTIEVIKKAMRDALDEKQIEEYVGNIEANIQTLRTTCMNSIDQRREMLQKLKDTCNGDKGCEDEQSRIKVLEMIKSANAGCIQNMITDWKSNAVKLIDMQFRSDAFAFKNGDTYKIRNEIAPFCKLKDEKERYTCRFDDFYSNKRMFTIKNTFTDASKNLKYCQDQGTDLNKRINRIDVSGKTIVNSMFPMKEYVVHYFCLICEYPGCECPPACEAGLKKNLIKKDENVFKNVFKAFQKKDVFDIMDQKTTCPIEITSELAVLKDNVLNPLNDIEKLIGPLFSAPQNKNGFGFDNLCVKPMELRTFPTNQKCDQRGKCNYKHLIQMPCANELANGFGDIGREPFQKTGAGGAKVIANKYFKNIASSNYSYDRCEKECKDMIMSYRKGGNYTLNQEKPFKEGAFWGRDQGEDGRIYGFKNLARNGGPDNTAALPDNSLAYFGTGSIDECRTLCKKTVRALHYHCFVAIPNYCPETNDGISNFEKCWELLDDHDNFSSQKCQSLRTYKCHKDADPNTYKPDNNKWETVGGCSSPESYFCPAGQVCVNPSDGKPAKSVDDLCSDCGRTYRCAEDADQNFYKPGNNRWETVGGCNHSESEYCLENQICVNPSDGKSVKNWPELCKPCELFERYKCKFNKTDKFEAGMNEWEAVGGCDHGKKNEYCAEGQVCVNPSDGSYAKNPLDLCRFP